MTTYMRNVLRTVTNYTTDNRRTKNSEQLQDEHVALLRGGGREGMKERGER